MTRLFAALPVPFEIAEALAKRQVGLVGARWSPFENLHITLRFFGEVSETQAEDLDLALSAKTGAGFELYLDGSGAFGEGEVMRAVWARVADSEPLSRLANRCETAACKCGLKPEGRKFKPHITLAYLKHAPAPAVAAWVQSHSLLKSPTWRARSFGLYSSWRTESGSRYQLERSYPLV
jgi:2'-5' RNA ligase